MADVNELYNEAEKLKDEGKDEEAIAKLTEVIDEEEGFTLAHLALSILYNKVGKVEEAIRHGCRATELEPNDPFNFTALSITYQRAFQATQDRKYIPLAEEAMMQAHQHQR